MQTYDAHPHEQCLRAVIAGHKEKSEDDDQRRHDNLHKTHTRSVTSPCPPAGNSRGKQSVGGCMARFFTLQKGQVPQKKIAPGMA